MEQKIYKPSKDKFTKARGGNSELLSISCSQCEKEILLYQKDGPGFLKRMYLDKILAPIDLVDQVSEYSEKSNMISLTCPECQNLIASPMLYEKEHRLAYRVINGSLKKKINKQGKFPS